MAVMSGLLQALAARSAGSSSMTPAVSRSVVQSLLAKHGAAMPNAGGGGGIGKPDLGPSPVELDPPVVAPVPAPSPAPVPTTDMATVAAGLPGGDIKKPNGLFDRIGDFLHSDEGRAALLRSGAATLQGGLGAGIEAGANFVDKRRLEASAAAQAAAEFGLKKQEVGNNYNLGLGRLDIEGEQAGETARHNRAGEGNDQYRTQADIYKHLNPSGDTRLRVAEDRFQHITPSGDVQATQEGENYRFGNVSGNTAAEQAGETFRQQHPVATPQPTHPATLTTHVHYTTTPEEYTANGPRLKPSMVTPANPGDPTTISSDAEYSALPSGSRFKGPDGQIRIKP